MDSSLRPSLRFVVAAALITYYLLLLPVSLHGSIKILIFIFHLYPPDQPFQVIVSQSVRVRCHNIKENSIFVHIGDAHYIAPAYINTHVHYYLVFTDGEPIKLPDNLESLPRADHFPTQRHRWNTNEVSFPFVICLWCLLPFSNPKMNSFHLIIFLEFIFIYFTISYKIHSYYGEERGMDTIPTTLTCAPCHANCLVLEMHS